MSSGITIYIRWIDIVFMASFWDIVNRVIANADVILLVLDSRMADSTRNIEIEDKVAKAGKPLIYVLNKCDLVDKEYIEAYRKKLPNSIFLSAKYHLGTTMLRSKIAIVASKNHIKGQVKVGILGYPNVGKSSLINALNGKGAAPVSSVSGYTKAVQNVNVGGDLMLIDTPGVIPYKENEELKHSLISTVDHNKEKDPDVVALNMMTEFPGSLEAFYGVEVKEDKYETLEDIAKKYNMVLKAKEVDTMRAARMILKDWQAGKIKQR